MWNSTEAELEQFGEYLLEHWWIVLAVVAALGLILFLAHRYRQARRPIVPFKSGDGDVQVAPQTIRGIITGTACRVEGVEHATAHYSQKGRKLVIDLTIHLQASANLVTVQERLKRRIRRALQSQIGMDPDNVKPIRIRVTRIIGEAPAPAEEEEAVDWREDPEDRPPPVYRDEDEAPEPPRNTPPPTA